MGSLCLYSNYRTFLMLVFKLQNVPYACIQITERYLCLYSNTERSLCLYSNTERFLCLYSNYRTLLMLVFKLQNVPYACIQITERYLCLYSNYRTFLMLVFKLQA